MLAIAVGWQIYARTGSAFYLGLVGLAQFLPMFLLTLVVGHVADRYDWRAIARLCQTVEGGGSLLLAWGSFSGRLGKESLLVLVCLLGAARAFEGPTMQAFLPGLTGNALFPRAVAWSTASSQTASIVGPALGELLYTAGPTAAYAGIGALFPGAALSVSLIHSAKGPPRGARIDLRSLFAGIGFIRGRPIVLGTISLDLSIPCSSAPPTSWAGSSQA